MLVLIEVEYHRENALIFSNQNGVFFFQNQTDLQASTLVTLTMN